MGGWADFYQVTGEAAATLTGLLFLAVTLTSGRQAAALREGMRLFSTPTLVQFGSVLMASVLALVPAPHDRWSAWALLALAGVGTAYALRIMFGLIRFPRTTHWSDPWFYGVLMAAGFLGLTAGALARVAGYAFAPDLLGAAVLTLLLLAVRNAWDLITWLAPGGIRRTSADLDFRSLQPKSR